MDHNTVSRPRRVKARPAVGGPPETVEEFEARRAGAAPDGQLGAASMTEIELKARNLGQLPQ